MIEYKEIPTRFSYQSMPEMVAHRTKELQENKRVYNQRFKGVGCIAWEMIGSGDNIMYIPLEIINPEDKDEWRKCNYEKIFDWQHEKRQ
jgi:hypothetical protein